MKNWKQLRGKQVVVTAAGTVYRGEVIEMGERALLLKSAGGHREIAWEKITRLEEEGARKRFGGPSALGGDS